MDISNRQGPATPFPQSFWVIDGLLCAGCYPGDLSSAERDHKLLGLLACGIRHIVNLMESDERDLAGRTFEDYSARFTELAAAQSLHAEVTRLPIKDASVPSEEQMKRILEVLEHSVASKTPTYLHCWGGHGRTSTVIACYLMNRGKSIEATFDAITHWRSGLPKKHHPFEGQQEAFVRTWAQRADCSARATE